MDLLGKMVQGTGCAVDGTVAAQNPLSRAMDSVLQARGGPARSRHAPGPQPGYVGDMQAQMQRQNFARGADAQLLQGFEQEALHRSRMEAAFHAGEMQQQQHPMAMMHPHHAAFEAAFEESKHAARFGGPISHHHHPPPPFMQQQQQRPHAQEAWVDDFQSLHMDDAWQSAGKSHQELAWEETKAPAPTYYQQQQQNYSQQQFEEASEQITQDRTRQLETRSASSEMARTMSQNPDPKWQQSEFLQFMNKVGAGELELDEEKNAVVGDVLRSEGALEGAWGESEGDVRANRDLYESSWQQSGSSMERAFADAAGVPQHGMEGAWESARGAPGASASASASASAFDGAWGDSHTAEEKVFADAWGEGDNLVRTRPTVHRGKCGGR